MSDLLRNTPRRVLQEAYVRGVHSDCLAAEWDKACDACIHIIHDIYEEFYPSKDVTELALNIYTDIKKDRDTSG